VTNWAYITVTVHGVSHRWVLESFILELVPVKGSETAKNLAEIVQGACCMGIGTECIVVIAPDGGTNMKAAVLSGLNA